MMTAINLRKELRKKANKEKEKILRRFFKTGKGEYAEGDKFLGVTVPETRKIIKNYLNIDIENILELLRSDFHEERLAAILILIHQFRTGDEKKKKSIFEIYFTHIKYINNWDLVDVSVAHIVGAYLFDKRRGRLYKLAKSKNLWKRRIAIVATFHFIKKNQFDDTFKIAKILLEDDHDLIHKAVGWMLREVGKRDVSTMKSFLQEYHQKMSRTTLRYAIEKLPEKERVLFLHL